MNADCGLVRGAMEWQELGTMPYSEASKLQERLRELRIAGLIPDRMLLVEHPPVLTVGKRDSGEDFCSPPEEIAADGIDVIKTNRGGRVTYHGPGQLVGYFICSLESLGMGVKDFVRAIEEASIRTLADFGIRAHRDKEHPGVWIGRDKICAIGLNVSRGVTQHGFALNVDCDLSAYRHIVACGIRGRGVTSMTRLLPKPPPMRRVKKDLVDHVGSVLSRTMVEFMPT